mmetsp:Transcript_20520/g.61584  ORF Transcript_20520/g.61584 Transcript_20520/m.61584 type:complete len:347 (-) Transcript_20520:388-1428(-)
MPVRRHHRVTHELGRDRADEVGRRLLLPRSRRLCGRGRPLRLRRPPPLRRLHPKHSRAQPEREHTIDLFGRLRVTQPMGQRLLLVGARASRVLPRDLPVPLGDVLPMLEPVWRLEDRRDDALTESDRESRVGDGVVEHEASADVAAHEDQERRPPLTPVRLIGDQRPRLLVDTQRAIHLEHLAGGIGDSRAARELALGMGKWHAFGRRRQVKVRPLAHNAPRGRINKMKLERHVQLRLLSKAPLLDVDQRVHPVPVEIQAERERPGQVKVEAVGRATAKRPEGVLHRRAEAAQVCMKAVGHLDLPHGNSECVEFARADVGQRFQLPVLCIELMLSTTPPRLLLLEA